MRIVIDLQGMQSKFSSSRGVGRYTASLVRAIIVANSKHDIVLALNGAFYKSIEPIKEYFSDIFDIDNIVVWQNYINSAANSPFLPGAVEVSEVIRESFLASLNPDIIFSTNLQEGLIESAVKSVKRIRTRALYCSTLHDLVPYYYPEYTSDISTRKWYYRQIDYAVNSDIILTVSHSSKSDIMKFLNVDENKIFVIENGYEPDIFNDSQISDYEKIKLLKKYNIQEPFILYIGGNEPHKNIHRLLSAYASSNEIYDKVNLVLAGTNFLNDYKTKNIISQLNLEDKVFMPGYIYDEDLPFLYKQCQCFVFPSTHEGFGLPALEAMACGAPVIGANSSSIREIINFKKALFNPYDINDIADKIKLVLNDNAYAQEIVEHGLKQVKNYSWEKSAITLLEVFEKFNSSQCGQDCVSNNIVDDISCLNIDIHNDVLIAASMAIAESFRLNRSNKIYLDFSSIIAHDDRSGIQRTSRAIAYELFSNKKVEAVIVYSKQNDLRFFKANQYMHENFGICEKKEDEEIEFIIGDRLIYLDLHPSNAIAHKQMNINLRNRGVKVYHVVYDLIPIMKPEMFWPELCKEFEAWLNAVSESNGAICISKSVALELNKYLESNSLKRKLFEISYFHLGADLQSSIPTRGGIDAIALERLKYFSTTKTFLMVGTIEPRKGHKQVLEAFEELWLCGYDINLVLVGRLGWGMNDFEKVLINHTEYNKRIFYLKSISDEHLEMVYRSSICLIAASEAEGFGLPLIEAAKNGVPIITRDIPIFREVAGENAYYFADSKLPSTIAQSLISWLKLYSKGSHPKSSNLKYIDWKESTSHFLNLVFHKKNRSVNVSESWGYLC